MIKERPILFSAPMVRALLEGSKTQTRRVCKNKIYSNGIRFDGNEFLCHNDYLPPSATLMDVKRGGIEYTTSDHEGWESECPYGQPGDRLWVREAWMPVEHDVQPYRYRATNPSYVGKWKPSIHMPRIASRITLEITGVRVERLQRISEADAIAEGASISVGPCTEPEFQSYTLGYINLWESINGPGSWDANPWVWAVEFKRVES